MQGKINLLPLLLSETRASIVIYLVPIDFFYFHFIFILILIFMSIEFTSVNGLTNFLNSLFIDEAIIICFNLCFNFVSVLVF